MACPLFYTILTLFFYHSNYLNNSNTSEKKGLEKILILIINRLEPSGYNSLPDLWPDLRELMNLSIQLQPYQAIQRLLSLTNYFYEFCHGYRADTEKDEYEEYFNHVENMWVHLFRQEGLGMTDKIRALNVLRDGHQLAADEYGISDALNRALEAGIIQEQEQQLSKQQDEEQQQQQHQQQLEEKND